MAVCTIIRHRACDTDIFVIPGQLNPGDPVTAADWHPIRPEWPQPKAGDQKICPNCGEGFITADTDLERRVEGSD